MKDSESVPDSFLSLVRYLSKPSCDLSLTEGLSQDARDCDSYVCYSGFCVYLFQQNSVKLL